MKLEYDLHAEFTAAVQASHRPASQAVLELMREFIERQDQAAFLHRKVDAGQGRDNAAVEADFAACRAQITDRA